MKATQLLLGLPAKVKQLAQPRFKPGTRLVNGRGGLREVVDNRTLTPTGKPGYILKRLTASPGIPESPTRPIGGTFWCDANLVENGTFKDIVNEVEKGLCA